MAQIRPKDLPAGTATAGSAVIFDNGTTVEKTTPKGLVDVAVPLASQGAAEAGSSNDDRMSSLRAKQAIDAQVLAPLASTSGPGLIGFSSEATYPAGTLGARATRRYIDVADYASADDTQNAFLAIQAALDDAYGREIVFSSPRGGTRFYRCLDRAQGRLYLPLKSRIIFEPGAVLDFSDYGRSGTNIPYLYASGEYAAAVDLASDAALGSHTITVSSGAGAAWARGDFGYLVSDARFTENDSTLGTKGEWISVVEVTGDVLTLAGPVRDSYLTTDNARVYRFTDPAEITIDNPQIIGAGRFDTDVLGDRGIQIIHGVGCQVNGGYVKYADFMGVCMQVVLNGKIDGTYCEMEPKGANEQNQYPFVVVNGCEATEIHNCDALGGKEGYALSVSGEVQGPTRDIVFANNRARNMWRSGFCSHDNHVNWICEGNIAEDCEQGFDIRISNAHIKGNIIRRTGWYSGNLDCGVQLGSGAGKVHLEGNYYEDVLRCTWMPSSISHEVEPGDITIKGEVGRDIRSRGILLDYRTSGNPTGLLGTVTVTDCDFGCVTDSPARGVEIHGRWNKPVVARNTLRGGDGGASVYIHATSNSGTVGSVSPSIIDNEYDDGFTVPVIQHSSGIAKISGNRGIGHWVSGEVIRGSKTFDFGSIAAGASESTTVTVTGAAVGDGARAWLGATSVGLQFTAQVTGADTVTVTAINYTASPVDAASATLYAEVTKA